MRRVLPLLALAACAAVGKSEYVPGGEGLSGDTRAAYRQALYLEHSGEPAEALAILTELCSEHPTRLAFHVRRLRLVRATEGAAAAVALYDPPPPGVDRVRAEILVRLAGAGDSDDAADLIDTLRYAVENEPNEAYWHLALADVELAAHEPAADRAEDERKRGDIPGAEESMGRAKRQLELAREHAETALSLDPLFAEPHLLLGYICTRQADLADTPDGRRRWRALAEERYDRALALDPESLPGLLNRAENLLAEDRYTEAVNDLRAAARIAPGVALVWSNLGAVYYRIGRLTNAVSAYERALELDPASARTRAAYADCLRRGRDPDRAVLELQRAREDAGDDDDLLAEIAFKLGTIHEHERRYRAAVEEYERHILHAERAGEEGAKARSRIQAIHDHAFE